MSPPDWAIVGFDTLNKGLVLRDRYFHVPEDQQRFGKSKAILHTTTEVIDDLYRMERIELPDDIADQFYPNQPIVLTAQSSSEASALAMMQSHHDALRLIDQEISYFNIKGRNKEQKFLFDAFQHGDIRCVAITGQAGTGKTLLTSAYALSQMLEQEAFDQLVLSKPLEIVTGSRYWGTVPGDEDEKFAPFLRSYMMTFKNLVGEKGVAMIETAVDRDVINFLPLELMRGVSLQDTLCWYDEVQNLNDHACESLGSRIDDEGNSELILSGDLNQIDHQGLSQDKTGMTKLVTSRPFLEAPYTAHIHLVENERGSISQMFYDVFSDKHDDYPS